jgi:ubiquinol oxidase
MYGEIKPVTNFVAKSMTKFFRFFADTFFAKRYGHRAVVLETVAGVPGMVAGMLVHLKSLRTHKRGYGPIIRKLLAEAENERMHLMFFIEIAQPNKLERGLIITAQFIFWHFYLVMYLISPRTAHMMTHYFEEEAVKSYTRYRPTELLKMLNSKLMDADQQLHQALFSPSGSRAKALRKLAVSRIQTFQKNSLFRR